MGEEWDALLVGLPYISNNSTPLIVKDNLRVLMYVFVLKYNILPTVSLIHMNIFRLNNHKVLKQPLQKRSAWLYKTYLICVPTECEIFTLQTNKIIKIKISPKSVTSFFYYVCNFSRSFIRKAFDFFTFTWYQRPRCPNWLKDRWLCAQILFYR